MERTFYNTVLNNYLKRADSYHKENCIEYSDGEFFRSMGEAYQEHTNLLPWGTQPSVEILESTKFLRISPPEKGLYPEYFPDFINQFKQLETLYMPLIYICSPLFALPAALKNLTLINDRDQIDNLGDNKRERVKRLLFPDIKLPGLKGLSVVTLSSSSMIADGFLNIQENQFPDLEFLRCIPEAKAKYQILDNFTNLKHLWISIGKGINIFEKIKSPLLSLYLDGAGEGLDFSQITNIPSLEIIQINSSYDEIDFNHFVDMPNLKEIVILNSPYLKNIEVLLEMPQLQSLDVADCKNAFTTDKIKLFESRRDGFKRLSIPGN